MYWMRFSKKTDEQGNLNQEKQELAYEVFAAKLEWEQAQNRLDFVIEKEQIDYAIFALEAAEKRYEMLLSHAKKMNLNVLEIMMDHPNIKLGIE